MGAQLDILALEPFYGGVRRVMMESLIHVSRHRWTLLRLPPRRIERRLSAAAHWFAELLQRHSVGHFDLLFVSEALNLADLYRLMPELLRKPSVVYFHSNQLPDANATGQMPLDLVNLNSAAAATEIWLNSLYHLRTFLARAAALVRRIPELSARNPIGDITAKARIMLPPIDQSLVRALSAHSVVAREKRTLVLETTDADFELLNRAFGTLRRRGEVFKVLGIGDAREFDEAVDVTPIPERDPEAQARAMCRAGVYLSARPGAPCDHQAVQALAAGCWPLLPQVGAFRELLPDLLHAACLYETSADVLSSRLQDLWHLERPSGYEYQLQQILRGYDPVVAAKAMDDRLADLVGSPVPRR